NGTLYNGAATAAGIVGNALYLPATNSHVRVSDATNLEFSTGMTLETWIYRTRTGVQEDVISKWDAVPNVDQRGYLLRVPSDDRVFLDLTLDGGTATESLFYSTSLVPTNQWTHIAATFDGANVQVYVNGRMESTTPFTGPIFPGNSDLGIGGTVGGAPNGVV